MKKFIETRRLFAGYIMRDIIRTDDIENIYIDQPEGDKIVIKLTNGKKKEEKYKNRGYCTSRFNWLVEHLGAGKAMNIPCTEFQDLASEFDYDEDDDE